MSLTLQEIRCVRHGWQSQLRNWFARIAGTDCRGQITQVVVLGLLDWRLRHVNIHRDVATLFIDLSDQLLKDLRNGRVVEFRNRSNVHFRRRRCRNRVDLIAPIKDRRVKG